MQQPIRTACLVLITLAAAPSVARGQSAAVTFTRDVAPILYRNCVECHRPTMFAPMSLVGGLTFARLMERHL